MPGLALLSPINEAEELSPYQSSFRRARLPGQRSPIGKSPLHYVRDTAVGTPVSPETSMDDLWIYDCYVSEDATSPGGYPRSPSTASHTRSISLPSTTASFSPVVSVPVVREPNPSIITTAPHPASRDADTQPAPVYDRGSFEGSPSELAYDTLSSITTSVFSPGTPAEYPEYSPLEQEAMSIWEVIDELAAAADRFAGLEMLLADAGAAEVPPEMDEDVVFWFIEGLNLLIGDCGEVARDLLKFNEYVEQLLQEEQAQHALAVPEAPTIKHASFSEQEMKAVLATAASIPNTEVQQALAALEASSPVKGPSSKRKSRDRPPSLKLSTDDAVLIQALRPRSRFESVGALGRFSDAESGSRDEMLKKHRAYAIYQEETPTEDNWSTKSIVDYDAIEPMAEIKLEQPDSAGVARPRPTSGQTVMPRPMSSPVVATGRSAARRPPSLTLTDQNSERSSQHSASSSVSSLFSALPRSSFTTNSSPRSSPRQSITFEGKMDKPRFPTSSGNIKNMFSKIFKKREGREGREAPRTSSRMFSKRTAGSSASVDATLSALSLSAMPPSTATITPLALGTERDPFAMSPPPPLRTPPLQMPSPHARSASEASPLDSYSSMFNPVKAASRHPPQPLFGEPTP